MILPKNYHHISVGQFRAIHNILTDKPAPGGLPVPPQLLALLTGTPIEQIHALPLGTYKAAVEKLHWLWHTEALESYPLKPVIKLDGITYNVTL